METRRAGLFGRLAARLSGSTAPLRGQLTGLAWRLTALFTRTGVLGVLPGPAFIVNLRPRPDPGGT